MNTCRNMIICIIILAVAVPVFAFQEPAITIEDIVRIKYVANHTWSPDGRYIAFTWDNEGQQDLWMVSVRDNRLFRLSDTKDQPSSLTWSPDGSVLLYVEDGDIWQVDPGTRTTMCLIQTEAQEGGLQFIPDGSGLLFTRDGHLWLRSFPDDRDWQLSKENRRISGASISPDGKKIVYTADIGGNQRELQIMDLSTGKVIWNYSESPARSPLWLHDGRRLLVQRTTRDGNGRIFLTIDTQTGEEVQIFEEYDEYALTSSRPMLSPTEDKFLLIRNPDGWDHLWVVSIPERQELQLTSGEFEDSYPAWSPDGKHIIFSSNMDASGERHLYLISPDGGKPDKLTGHMRGTNIGARWSSNGRTIAFTHSGPYTVSEIYTMPPKANANAVQHTRSMPDVWTRDNIVVPEEIIYKGALDWDIHAWLFKPKNFDPSIKYPAVVWVHGGPIRQMRYGWHPSRSYSLFHSYHQRLLQMGYVVLSVNFRGGIGYGKEFLNAIHMKMGIDDVVDVVNGAEYLKRLPYVAPERIGVWGLSYGGFMTLQALGKHPGVFSMGINVAGVYNWATQVEIYRGRGGFIAFLGGTPDESPEAYRVGSPITYVQNINVPLLNLQGTADRNVPFSQMDEIVQSMVKYNLDFDFFYYPDQVHVFQDGDVWRHAFRKIDEYFEKHLKNKIK